MRHLAVPHVSSPEWIKVYCETCSLLFEESAASGSATCVWCGKNAPIHLLSTEEQAERMIPLDVSCETLHEFIRSHLEDVLSFHDCELERVFLTGSRLNANAHPFSDLDVAFEYTGESGEDDLFNELNVHKLIYENVKIDFIPLSLDEGRTFESIRKLYFPQAVGTEI